VKAIVKVLFLASNPFAQSHLALDGEIRAIITKIRSADHRDAIDLIPAWAVQPDDLQQLMLQHKPRVVHFSGHGTSDTPLTNASQGGALTSRRDMVVHDSGQVEQIVFMGENGKPQPMSMATLVDLFSVLRDEVHLVLLNACHSELIAAAIGEVIPCSIGMRGEITDNAAVTFAAAFYRALGFGRTIQEAFYLGRNALMHLQVPEDQTPRLYCRKEDVDPAKVVLVGDSTAPLQLGKRNDIVDLTKRSEAVTGTTDFDGGTPLATELPTGLFSVREQDNRREIRDS
jgi:CHAT domain